MKIADRIYMVGSGQIGLSDDGDCHVYLIDCGGELALVDSGVGRHPESLVDNIRAEGFDEKDVRWLLLTHCHADHAGGCRALKELTSAQIVCTPVEGRLLAEGTDWELGLEVARRGGVYPTDYCFEHVRPDRLVSDGETFPIGPYTVRVIQVSGHSWACACYLLEADGRRILFSSDVVFFGGTIGLGNWPGSALEPYRRDIGKLSDLAVDALLPGHYLWTLRNGQHYLDTAIKNLAGAWVPPAWQHQHAHF